MLAQNCVSCTTCWAQASSSCIRALQRTGSLTDLCGQRRLKSSGRPSEKFDKDEDGYINCRDLGNCMCTMGYVPTEMELIELSQQINMNRGDHVDFDDFVELMGPKLLAETVDIIGVKELRDAFRESDTNGDGEISTSELPEAMRKLLGHQVGHRDIEQIIQVVDLNEGVEQLEFSLIPRGDAERYSHLWKTVCSF